MPGNIHFIVIARALIFVVILMIVVIIVDCSWVKKFGEHNGLDVLLDILRACVSIGFTGKDALLRKIQHHCVKCIKAFMNNKVMS